MPETEDTPRRPREDHFTSTVEGAAAFERHRAHDAGEDRDWIRIGGRHYEIEDTPDEKDLP